MIWRWLAGVLLGLVAGLVVAVFVLTGTPAGARWLAGRAETFTAGALRLQGVDGTLRGGLHAQRVDVAAGDWRVGIEGLELVVQPAALLAGRLSVRRLAASRVVVDLGPPGPEEPFVMPTVRTPILVRVRELAVPLLEVRRGGDAWMLTGLHLAGRLRDSRLVVEEARGGFAGLIVQVAGQAQLRAPLPLEARVGWSLAARQLSGAGTVRGNLAALALAQALRLPEPATLQATVRDPAADPQIEARLRWPALARELPVVGRVESRAGQATISGRPADWRMQLASTLAGDRLPALEASLRAHGDATHAVVEQAVAQGGFGTLAARGVIGLAGSPGLEPQLRLDIIAREVDTAALRPGLAGRLSGRLHLTTAPGAPLRLDILALQGRLMDRLLAGSGTLTYGEGTLGFSRLVVQAGPNRLRADGSVGARLAGRFELDAPDLAVLWPGLAGSVSGRAKLAGTRERPVIDLDARGRSLALDGNHLAALQLRAQVDRAGRADIDFTASGLRAGTRPLGDLGAQIDGTLDAHRLRASLHGGPVVVSLDSAGRWDGVLLHHQLSLASVTAGGFGAWRLAGEPELVVGATQARIGAHCWAQAPTSICIDRAQWSPRESAIAAQLRDLDLMRFDPWLGEDLAITGQASAELVASLTPAGATGSFHWRQQGTTVWYTGGDEPLVTALPVVEADARLMPDAAEARIDIQGQDGLHLAGRLRMLAPPGLDAPIEAQVSGGFPDIAPLVPWLAGDVDVAEAGGRVTLEARAAGSLNEPRLTGAVRLLDGSMALADLGVKLEAINVALIGEGGGTLRLEGGATAGGALGIDGELRPLATGGPQGWLRLRGERLDAVRLPDRYVQVSPDLRLDYAPGRLSAAGRIAIPQADIVVRELPESAVSPSPDAVVRDRPPRPGDSAISTAIAGEVEIELGRNVHLKGFGLDTLLEGNLKLSQASDRTPRGFGVLHLREGRFGAYGKALVIERGTLGFSGPLDDPAVDIRASRRVDYEGRSVTAGIQLSGTASRPQSQVFSDPAMSQADAISYLVTGHPLQTQNPGDQSAVAGAALALGVQQTAALTEAIGHAVTLDELSLAGGGTLEQTQLVAGKQLGSDLYVRFSYGLFNRIGSVLARYRLNRNFSIEAASGEDQSLDLVYSVERD